VNLKELAGRKAAQYVNEGMVVGLGSGSTATYAIQALGERVAQGLRIRALSTSEASTRLAEELGIELVTFEEQLVVDLTIDGADEVDLDLNLIKGLGGALLREKIVAAASTREIIVVDPAKLVPVLGTRSPLPVEVLPFGWPLAQGHLVEQEQGLRAELRLTPSGEEPYETDNGNFILDCHFPHGIDDAAATESRINTIPSVVDNGLFVGLADLVIIGEESGDYRLLERS
jgi:ribose 5-phosphate isomerase A